MPSAITSITYALALTLNNRLYFEYANTKLGIEDSFYHDGGRGHCSNVGGEG